MRLSIIIPTLNEERHLPATLERVAETAGDAAIECLVVDGGSGDGTRQLLRDSEVPWIASAPGRARQMNAGAAATRGEVLLFLHADTLLPEGWLAAIVAAAEAGHVAGFFRLRLDSERRLLRWVGRLVSLRSSLTGIATGDQAIFVTRPAFEALGGYPPLPLFEDVELSARLRRHGAVARLDATVVTSARRWERRGPLRTIFKMWILRLLYSLGVGAERLARLYGEAR